MNNLKLKELLIEAKETIENMLNNLENKSAIKFLAGKLSLTTEIILSALKEN